MTVNSSRNALKRRTWALFMFFFLPGLLMASWATRTPAIRDILSVSIAEMGGVLFGLSIGSMSGILCSAWLVKRFGTRNVILVTMSCALIGMMILSLALWLTSPLLFAVGLGVFGASFGSAEVAINVEGAAVEREMNKTVLPMMHGFYSLGTLAGAGVGMALTAFGVPATVHILLAALVGIAPIYIAIQAIPDGTGKNAADGTQHGEKGIPFYRDIQLLLIGVVVLAMAFAEGSANDWLPLLMVDGHGFSPTSGSLIYAGFTLGMTVGRFTGGWFIDRYSRVAVVRASALMGALGIGLIIFIDSAWVAGVSIVLWGLGASLGFPLTISAASDTGPDAPTRVSVVATTGYLAFLVGPPLLGYLGEHYGLRSAMLVVLALVILAAIVTKAVAKPDTKTQTAMENS
ncbi:MFS transporter [Escherichia coli]|uniref:MFS transporter n=1 Tax=Escherichia coli TaxID=562 RepID=UPI001F3BF7CC|nr:MFS transporter [Escherichia coli]MCF2158097.1 MFS transporter [Escherichia coli]